MKVYYRSTNCDHILGSQQLIVNTDVKSMKNSFKDLIVKKKKKNK